MSGGWLAVSALGGVAALGAALGVHLLVYAYKEGRKAQRLEQAEARLAALEGKAEHQPQILTSVELLKASLDGMRDAFAEMRGELARRIDRLEHDIRNILTGKVAPARRAAGE